MAALPSPTQVAGAHCAIYEAYYHQVDPNGSGMVQALDAARFLKKSRLSDVVLSKIWDLSDPTGKGYLDKTGLFVALKLVALAQAGKDINMSNIHSEAPPPKVGELPKVPPTGAPARPAAPSPAPTLGPHGDWSMKQAEREKYSQLFDSLQPNNGLIAGNKVKGVLMESKLPLETLGKIWDLADQDKDGMLDRHEFMVAMHLVYKALEKHAVPTTLPPELRARPARPPSRPASPQPRAPPPRPAPPPHSNAALLDTLLDFSSPPSQSPLSSHAALPGAVAPPGAGAGARWVVSAGELAESAAAFAAADQDRDGFVSGAEIKQTFLDSGLPQHTLAHIWALCDTCHVGKLSRNQFALAQWLVRRALRGEAPPAALAPDMLPPPDHTPIPAAAAAAVPAVMAAPTLGPQPTPEMEAIAREVDALARERVALEADIAAKEREHAATSSEVAGLQSELDTLTATLKQLENQKGEAGKRLNDLKAQVEKLRSQVAAQEAAAAETAGEVAARRAALHSLRDKERALRGDADAAAAEADAVTAQLRRTVLAVSQANIKIAYLEEQLRLITEATAALAAGGPAAHAHTALAPQFAQEHLDKVVRGATPSDALEDEPFPQSNGFSNGHGFSADPFKESAPAPAPAPAAPHDPFAPSGHTQPQDGFGADPFAASADPFAGDAFAPHENNNKGDDSQWENDPFAVLHAPTRASPAAGGGGGGGGAGPALPPKSHKTPPPRPAPPRPNPPHKARAAMDFADDPFKDYRYEDPFNIEDPFADVTAAPPAARAASVAGFGADDFFAAPAASAAPAARNGGFDRPPRPSGRVSAPPAAPAAREPAPADWGWPHDDWAADDNWAQPAAPARDAWASATGNADADRKTDNWAAKTDNWAAKTDNWAAKTENWTAKTDNWTAKTDNRTAKTDNRVDKSDDWAADWGEATDRNLNETWPSSTLPSKKEKSPRPVKYAKSLVHTIGGIGRTRQKKKAQRAEAGAAAAAGAEAPSEEQQWAWAAADSARLQREAAERRRREDAELQLALAISRQEK